MQAIGDMLIRPAMSSPYDARWGNGPHDYSPVVARTSVHAYQILSGRPSYIKAFLVHSRGLPANYPCNKCANVRYGDDFAAFAGCVSIPGVWGGACSNCIWPDAAASCVFPRPPGGSRSASPASSPAPEDPDDVRRQNRRRGRGGRLLLRGG
jgi:hypothetical protein